MPRRRRLRKVVAPPAFKGFKPYGAALESKEPVELPYEEYEAIKLADYKHMNHAEAAELMGVSRPTFARIYDSARKKIAQALVEAREIKTVYGNAQLDGSWYVCNDCHARFTESKRSEEQLCALCASKNIHPLRPE